MFDTQQAVERVRPTCPTQPLTEEPTDIVLEQGTEISATRASREHGLGSEVFFKNLTLGHPIV
jgi:hypothetical protein